VFSNLVFDASVDWLSVRRNNSSGGTIIQQFGSTTPFLTGQNLIFGEITGATDLRLRVGYAQWTIESRRLDGFSWNSSSPNLGGIGNVQIGSFSNFGVIGVNGIAGQSQFQSDEMNFRWQPVPWFTPFAGYRWITMQDQTSFTVVFPAFTALYSFAIPVWQSSGPQIGAEVRLIGPGTPWLPIPFFVDVDARIGSFHTNAITGFNLLPSTGGSFPGGASFASSGSQTYEIGVAVGYRISPNAEIRVGFRRLSIADALFANDYAAAALAQHSQSIVPGAQRLNIDMATIGSRLFF
jgi:hypothetical protein